MANTKGFQTRLTQAQKTKIQERYLAGERIEALAAEFQASKSALYLLTKDLTLGMRLRSMEEAAQSYQDRTLEERGWVAGIIDGEGWIGVASNNTYMGARISVANTMREMTDRLLALCGGNICLKNRSLYKNNRDVWSWDLYTLPTVRSFCSWVFPSLHVKRRQAALMVTYCDRRLQAGGRDYTDEDTAMVKEFHRLNKKGR